MNKISETIFRELNSTSKSELRRKSLASIKEACDLLDSGKARITVASIGRICQKQYGGPKSQSIRNSTDLMRYVKARAEEQTLHKMNVRESADLVITDQKTKAFVAILQEELYEARQAKTRIISAIRNLHGIDIDKLVAQQFNGNKQPQEPMQMQTSLSPALKIALKKLLDESHLIKFDLELYRDTIKSTGPANTIFLTKHDVCAIRQLFQENGGDSKKQI